MSGIESGATRNSALASQGLRECPLHRQRRAILSPYAPAMRLNMAFAKTLQALGQQTASWCRTRHNRSIAAPVCGRKLI
jgi:hypothetical protein